MKPFLTFQSVEWNPAVLVNEKKAELRLKLLASQNCSGTAELQLALDGVDARNSTTRIHVAVRPGVPNEHVVPIELTKGSAPKVFAQVMPVAPPPLCRFAGYAPLAAELSAGAQ